ncbi:MAG: hypothetical protein ACK5AV_03070 [Alphaproteobacteria bacterium]|jgi:hypothetical protein
MLQINQDSSISDDVVAYALTLPADFDSIINSAGGHCCQYIHNISILLQHPSISVIQLKDLASNQPYALRELLKYAQAVVHYIKTHNLSIDDIASISKYQNTRNLIEFLQNPSIFDDLYTKYGFTHRDLLSFSNNIDNLEAFSGLTLHAAGIRLLLDKKILSTDQLLDILQSSRWTILYSLSQHAATVCDLILIYEVPLSLVLDAIHASFPFDGFGAIAKNPALLSILYQDHDIHPTSLLKLAIKNCAATEFLFTKHQEGFKTLIKHNHIDARAIIKIAEDSLEVIEYLCQHPDPAIYYLDHYQISIQQLSKPFVGKGFGFCAHDLNLFLQDKKERIERIYKEYKIHPTKLLQLLDKSPSINLRHLLGIVEKLEKAGISKEEMRAIFYKPHDSIDLIIQHYKITKHYVTYCIGLSSEDIKALRSKKIDLGNNKILFLSKALNIKVKNLLELYSEALYKIASSEHLFQFLDDQFFVSSPRTFAYILNNHEALEYIIKHEILSPEPVTHIELFQAVNVANQAIRDEELYTFTKPPYNVHFNDIIRIILASNSTIEKVKQDPLRFASLIHFFNIYLSCEITNNAYKLNCSTFIKHFIDVEIAYNNYHITPDQCMNIMRSTNLDMKSILCTITILHKGRKCNIADCKYLAFNHPDMFKAAHNNIEYLKQALSSSTFFLYDLYSDRYNKPSIIEHINSHDVIEYMKEAQARELH